MSAAVEDIAPAVKKPADEVKAPVKEKKPKAPKEKKPKHAKTASHPPYFHMIKEALLALKHKGGSSPHAIAKYMEEKHKAVLPANFKKILGLQLKNQTARGNLVKIKASYKLTATAAPKSKKREAVKKKTKKVSRIAKPKQPKSIKSPAKSVRKATTATA